MSESKKGNEEEAEKHKVNVYASMGSAQNCIISSEAGPNAFFLSSISSSLFGRGRGKIAIVALGSVVKLIHHYAINTKTEFFGSEWDRRGREKVVAMEREKRAKRASGKCRAEAIINIETSATTASGAQSTVNR